MGGQGCLSIDYFQVEVPSVGEELNNDNLQLLNENGKPNIIRWL